MEIEMPRAELFPFIGRDRHFVGKYAVLVIEDFQCTGIFCFGRRALVAPATRIASRLSEVTRT